VLVLICSIFLGMYFSFKFWYWACKKHWTARVALVLIIILFGAWYYRRIHNSCKGWEYGIGGSKIDNQNGECIIPTPNYCELAIRDGLLNFAAFGQECDAQNMLFNKDQLPESLKHRQNMKKLGYPRPENWPNEMKYKESLYKKKVHANVIDMNDPDVPTHVKDNIEITVDITNHKSHRIEVDVKRNDTRAEELKIIREQVLRQDEIDGNTERVDHNVLILYIDNLSRAHFHRKMKELDGWLDQFTEDKNAELEATEFMRYHTVSKNTYKSNNAMYYGESAELNYNETTNVFRHFSKNGYITGMFRDECDYSAALFDDKLKRPHFYNWDHYGSTIACDTNYDRGNTRNLVLDSGRNSQYKRCLYGKGLHEIQLDYLTQFWEAYPDVRKVFRTSMSYAHEFTGELIKYADSDYVDLLQNFYEKGYLDDTQVIIVSDHGAHFLTTRTNVFPDDSRRMENALPLLISLTPRSVSDKNLEILRKNQQQFLNSHDIYATLKSFAVGKTASSEDVIDFSFFHEELPKRRDCDTKICDNCTHPVYGNPWCHLDSSKTQARFDEKSYFYFSPW